MGTKAIDPQSIRNVTIIGDPDETTRVVHRLFRRFARTAATVHWVTSRVDHAIHIAELSSHAPIADLERSVRVADGVIAVVNAAVKSTPRLETILRLADDHQVARLCLVTGLGHPAADFDRCVRTIAETRGAVPLTLQIPIGIGIGTEFEGVIDLVPMWALEPMAVEFYGSHWKVAEQWYRNLVATVMEQDPADSDAILGFRQIPPEHLHERIRCLTRIGDAVPVLCDAAPWSDDIAPLLDAIVRYLPSPMHVCQPEHALDY
ncbi:GTP-binding protein [Nocardia vinacea]|uniref:GTP-binding protein n=1 Tax=Nocardia vinacea TaxID=96468 RepID=A0ABZ1Z3M3_9NOCA|nr:GTP-binding protein [Nocardia vinacea]